MRTNNEQPPYLTHMEVGGWMIKLPTLMRPNNAAQYVVSSLLLLVCGAVCFIVFVHDTSFWGIFLMLLFMTVPNIGLYYLCKRLTRDDLPRRKGVLHQWIADHPNSANGGN